MPEKEKNLPLHLLLKANATDPELNKTVKDLVYCSHQVCVYIDSNLDVQWHLGDDHEAKPHLGEALSRAAVLEAQSKFIDNLAILEPIRRQIAEGLARGLDGSPPEAATSIFDNVEKQIKARNIEVAWGWYFTSSYKVAGGCVATLLAGWLCRTWVIPVIGPTAFELALGSLCGSLGALLSTTTRANRLSFDASAGKSIHQLEGLSRIGAGIIGAFFVSLAIKGGLIFGSIELTGSKLSLLLAACIAAGASERLIPSLVELFEKKVT
jgi:hypothetical protein